MPDIRRRRRVRTRPLESFIPSLDLNGVTCVTINQPGVITDVLFEDTDPVDATEDDILIDEADMSSNERTAWNTIVAACTP